MFTATKMTFFSALARSNAASSEGCQLISVAGGANAAKRTNASARGVVCIGEGLSVLGQQTTSLLPVAALSYALLTMAPQRITKPLVRDGIHLRVATWDEALDR